MRENRPDVFLFVVDSLREDAVSYDTDDPGDTPNFARFAERSVVFETAITHGVGTAPAMTALLSGALPLSHGGHWWLEESRPALAELLSGIGYETAAIHTNPNVSRLRNFDRGFDVFDENLLPIGGERVLDSTPDKVLTVLNKIVRVLTTRPYLPAEQLRRKVVSWAKEADGPRFVWTQFMDVHGPYLSHEGFAYRDKFRAERLWRRAAVTDPESITTAEHEELLDRYESEVHHWDEEFGKLLKQLRENGLFKDAMVIVTSDHGDEFDEHGNYGHGNNPYDELVRVPAVVNFPDDAYAETRIDEQVRLVDLVPTILDAVGVDHEDDRLVGHSLLDLLDGDAEPSDYEPAVTEKEVRGTDELRFGVRTNRFKYVEDRHENRTELYDLENDPAEQENVVEEFPERVREFGELVAERVADAEGRRGREDGAEGEARERLEELGYVE